MIEVSFSTSLRLICLKNCIILLEKNLESNKMYDLDI